MLRPTLFLLFAGILQIVSAHFELKYPTTRGFDENKEPTFPCGGFDTVQNRTQVPLKNAFVEINSGHTSYSYIVNVLAKNDPTTADFSTSELVQVSSGTRNYPQAACLSLNLSNNTSIANGSNATIQVIFNGGDGLLYQCTDVTFVDSAPNFDQSMCVNADGSSTTTSGSAPAANTTQSKASSVTVSSGFLLFVVACIYITL